VHIPNAWNSLDSHARRYVEKAESLTQVVHP
jgi:hypothetical protein